MSLFFTLILFMFVSCDFYGRNGDSNSSAMKVWNFSQGPDYTFNSDFISVSNKAQLKDLDLNYDSVSEYFRGTKSNVVYSGGLLSIESAKNANTLDSSWAPQWNSIEAHYRMESSSFIDSSPKNRNVVVTGTLATSTGKVGDSAVNFSGAETVKVSGINLSGDFTISMWVKRPNTSNDQFFIGQGINNNLQGLHIGFRSSGEFAFAFWGNDINSSTQYTTPNQWEHFVVVYDRAGQRMRIYHNSVLDGERWGSSDYAGSGDVCIGGGLGDCSLFPDGVELDEVAFWSSKLTPSEIDKIYQKQKSMFAGSYTSEVINAGLPFAWDTLNSVTMNATFEARSCDDALCVGESFSDITPGALIFPVNPFFQFKLNFASDVLPYPTLTNADFSNGTQRFYPGGPAIENASAYSFSSISGMAISAESCVKFRLSNDGGLTWFYYNGGWVLSSTDSEVSSANDVMANSSGFPIGNGSFKFRAVLSSDSSSGCELTSFALIP